MASSGEPVYPRECGGTPNNRGHVVNEAGLSPRVRGNRRKTGRAYEPCRSIPASAGEPDEHSLLGQNQSVYPRECGGTVRRVLSAFFWSGLSPRVRGNPGVAGHHPQACGSIPASAGEPLGSSLCHLERRVYPRECGGTPAPIPVAVKDPGLSPRVRGNHGLSPRVRGNRGSIPASAGEPYEVAGGVRPETVYPRECGGTWDSRCLQPIPEGLSPRVRGNLPSSRSR